VPVFTPTPICIGQENFEFTSKAASARPFLRDHSVNRCGGLFFLFSGIELSQVFHEFVDNPLRRRSSCRYAGDIVTEKNTFIKFFPILQMKGFSIVSFAQFSQFSGICTVQATEYEHNINLSA
jgi:hypothetical protein